MRLISAEDLMRKIEKRYLDACIQVKTRRSGNVVHEGIAIGINKARNIIIEQPTIEAEPVRHGRWIERCHELRNYDDYDDVEPGYEMFPVIITDYECSECGRVESEREPYCNCGAKMDGGAEDV